MIANVTDAMVVIREQDARIKKLEEKLESKDYMIQEIQAGWNAAMERFEKAESRLAKAVGALREIVGVTAPSRTCTPCDKAYDLAWETIAHIEET